MAHAINSQALFESANSFPVYKDDFADGSVLWICKGICVCLSTCKIPSFSVFFS